MTENQKYILRALADGKTQAEIARELGVTRQYVNASAITAVRPGKIDKIVYPRVREALRNSGMSIHALAQTSGISYPTVLHMMRGQAVPRWGTLVTLAQCLGISIEEMMQRDDDNE